MPTVNPEARLTAAEAAAYFRLTPQAINGWHARGRLPDARPDKRGRRTFVLRELLAAESASRNDHHSSRSAARTRVLAAA